METNPYAALCRGDDEWLTSEKEIRAYMVFHILIGINQLQVGLIAIGLKKSPVTFILWTSLPCHLKEKMALRDYRRFNP